MGAYLASHCINKANKPTHNINDSNETAHEIWHNATYFIIKMLLML